MLRPDCLFNATCDDCKKATKAAHFHPGQPPNTLEHCLNHPGRPISTASATTHQDNAPFHRHQLHQLDLEPHQDIECRIHCLADQDSDDNIKCGICDNCHTFQDCPTLQMCPPPVKSLLKGFVPIVCCSHHDVNNLSTTPKKPPAWRPPVKNKTMHQLADDDPSSDDTPHAHADPVTTPLDFQLGEQSGTTVLAHPPLLFHCMIAEHLLSH